MIQRFFFICCAFVWQLACQNQKTVQTVFPESQNSLNSKCQENKILNEYLIKKETGEIFIFKTHDQKEMIKSYIEPHLDEIAYVESHYLIDLKEYNVFNYHELKPNSNQFPLWGQERVQLNYAHQRNFKGQNVLVAVIDSAIDITHSALKNQIFINEKELHGQSNVDDDGNQLIDDIWGWNFVDQMPLNETSTFDHHGTHVAGIIVGNHELWSGIAPSAKILPISFIDNEGYGTILGAVSAIRYASQQGAHIINASWGGSSCSKILSDEIFEAIQRGILFVNASGNHGLNLDLYAQFPASFNFPLQITVSSSSFSDYLSGFSNTSYRLVHLAAPGEGIFSTLTNNHYGYMSGTSMSAPFVSGALAILKSAKPQATPEILRQAIFQGVDQKDYRVSTQGRLNIKKSLEWLLSQ